MFTPVNAPEQDAGSDEVGRLVRPIKVVFDAVEVALLHPSAPLANGHSSSQIHELSLPFAKRTKRPSHFAPFTAVAAGAANASARVCHGGALATH